MRRPLLAFALSFLIAFGPRATSARAQDSRPLQGYERVQGSGFVVEREPMDARRADAALNLLELARAEVEERLGAKVGEPAPLVILAPTDEEFDRRYRLLEGEPPAGDEAAVAWPALRTILVRAPRLDGTGAGLSVILRHELAHVVLAPADMRGAGVPRWLNEGLAQVAEGAVLAREEELELAAQARAGTLPDLADLERRFPHHAAGAQAYRESFAFLEWLDARTKRAGGVSGLVAALLRGETAKAWVKRASGLELRDAELEWRVDLAERRSVVESLVRSSAFWWGLVSLLAILAFVRNALVSRELRRKLAAAEPGVSPEVPSPDAFPD